VVGVQGWCARSGRDGAESAESRSSTTGSFTCGPPGRSTNTNEPAARRSQGDIWLHTPQLPLRRLHRRGGEKGIAGRERRGRRAVRLGDPRRVFRGERFAFAAQSTPHAAATRQFLQLDGIDRAAT
jgi:hypothetical protein